MKDEFSKFKQMRSEGRTAAEAYQTAKADGELFALRMLRTVYGLSLPDAKRVSGVMEKLYAPQTPVVGGKVYWEGSDTIEGTWIMEATVDDIRDGFVCVSKHRKFLIQPNGLEETLANGAVDRIPKSYFAKSLLNRLSEAASFWRELAEA
ncbi:MAG: hypothetical protein ACR2FY_14595 [Pirellulaceae bacterium]